MKPLPIVLLPGLDGTGILFQPLIDALPETLTPIVIAYPPDRKLDYEELLPYVLEKLPRSESFIILAESFSGPLAVMAAAKHPEGLAGVILCATFVSPPIPCIAPLVQLFARSFLFRMFPRVQEIKALLEGYGTPELRNLFAGALSQVQPRVMAARVRTVFRVDVSRELAGFDVPILYVAAEKDRVVPRRNLRILQRLNPNIQSMILPGPHPILQAQPKLAAEAITNFANSIPTDKVSSHSPS